MDVHTELAEALADILWRAEETQTPVPPLTQEHPELSADTAYQVQLRNVARKVERGDRVVGHKIGLTSKPMQIMLGVNEPDYGHLFASMRFSSGEKVDHPLLQPKVEPEVAFVLKEDLSGPDATLYDVLRATDYVVPAIEIIDSRIADWKIKLPDTVADNASSGCFVLGRQLTRAEDCDLGCVGMVMRINGEVAQTGATAAVLGHPAVGVAWLANKLAEFGTRLRAGDIVLSGSVCAAVPVRPGDRVSVSFGRLGGVEVRF
ncbi:2-keto-4-pentenoate hydratase [Alicyclobacillus macrosporangiidus]|uniref:2-keto-4-pentenoate hydratase n=1 Tax=Alicyclobacillus macrosporangiidus TaxID=392015 RepID=UPI0026E9AEB2|nr:2-keto-4-pentenoate hydratase [Alicyclobacillus macrosporangiidus]